MSGGCVLGAFGDGRLEKRGPCCWVGWLRVRACAFGDWLGVRGVGSWRLAGSWPTAG